MNALITPLLFSRFDTTAPAGLVPASSALALFRFANFAIIYFKKSGSALPVKLAIGLGWVPLMSQFVSKFEKSLRFG
jgi:hypothetical protein